MDRYPKDIKFKYSWRKYQQRVLDELYNHLTDGHLHVITPPGSGKFDKCSIKNYTGFAGDLL